MSRRKEFDPLKSTRPFVASMLSLFLWGSGQFYNGQLLKGFVFILTNWLIIPWVISVYDAYTTAQRIDYGYIKGARTYPWYVAAFLTATIGGITLCFFVGAARSVIQTFNRPQKEYYYMARSNLSMLSLASELFVQRHRRYPLSVDELLEADPPYISHNICGQIELNFKYSCQFGDQGYVFSAQPVEGIKGINELSVTTKGIWNHNDGQ